MKVVQARSILRVVTALQTGLIAGEFEDIAHDRAHIRQTRLLTDRIDGRRLQLLNDRHKTSNSVATAGTQTIDITPRGVLQRLPKTNPPQARMRIDQAQGLIPNATARGINHPTQRHRILGIINNPQIRNDVTDLFALIKTGAADHTVINPVAHQHIFNSARRIIGAIHHRNVTKGIALIGQFVDFLRDKTGLVVLIVSHITNDRFPITVRRPQPLFPPTLILGDHSVGRSQNPLRRTVILLQHNRPCLRIIPLEFLNITNRGTTERINRLIRITDHTQLARGNRSARLANQFSHQTILRMVSVLILINQHMAETPPIGFSHLGVIDKNRHNQSNKIIKIDRVGLPQPPLVYLINFSGQALAETTARTIRLRLSPLLRGGLLGRNQLIFPIRDDPQDRPGRDLFNVYVHLFKYLGDQTLGIIRIINGEVTVKPFNQVRLLSQNPHARGVESRHPHLLGNRPHQFCDTLPHLSRSLVSKGDGQNFIRLHTPSPHEVGNPAGQHRCLSRPRARNNQQRTACMQHGVMLLGVEPIQECFGAGVLRSSHSALQSNSTWAACCTILMARKKWHNETHEPRRGQLVYSPDAHRH